MFACARVHICVQTGCQEDEGVQLGYGMHSNVHRLGIVVCGCRCRMCQDVPEEIIYGCVLIELKFASFACWGFRALSVEEYPLITLGDWRHRFLDRL
jgi:hypothetical protein